MDRRNEMRDMIETTIKSIESHLQDMNRRNAGYVCINDDNTLCLVTTPRGHYLNSIASCSVFSEKSNAIEMCDYWNDSLTGLAKDMCNLRVEPYFDAMHLFRNHCRGMLAKLTENG